MQSNIQQLKSILDSCRLSNDFLSGSDFFMFRSAALVPLDCHCDLVVLILGVAPLPGSQTRKGPWECHDPQIPSALAEGSPDHPACQGAKVCYPSQLQHFNRLIYDHDLMIKSGCHKQRVT